MDIGNKFTFFVSVFILGVVGIAWSVGRYDPPLLPSIQQLPPIVVPLPPSAQIPQQQPVLDPDTEGCQVKIPKSMRLFNKSGSQCVWCTIQMLGDLHGSRGTVGLVDEFKHATGPSEVNRVLTQRQVKFQQVMGRDHDFLEEWVTQKKMGVGIGVNNNHAILVCHFERGKVVKIIDNADRQLRVQTWDWSKFERHFTGWVFVILPDAATVETDWNNAVDDGRLYRSSEEFLR